MTKPTLIFSHTGVQGRGDCQRDRNIRREDILKIAEYEGLIGVMLWSKALWQTDSKNEACHRADGPVEFVYAEQAAAAIDFVVNPVMKSDTNQSMERLINIAALGTDYGYIRTGFDVRGLPLIARTLYAPPEGATRPKYSPREVAKVMGLNVLEFLERNLPGKELSASAGKAHCQKLSTTVINAWERYLSRKGGLGALSTN